MLFTSVRSEQWKICRVSRFSLDGRAFHKRETPAEVLVCMRAVLIGYSTLRFNFFQRRDWLALQRLSSSTAGVALSANRLKERI